MSANGYAIIMVGSPASGKTTWCASYACETVHRDVDKTIPRMLKHANLVNLHDIVIFDATNATRKNRSEFISWARMRHRPIACVHITTAKDICIERNRLRIEDRVPDIAIYSYFSRFEAPSIEEGFDEIIVV
jgi:bifunctional polynucleotide phosphatase/kinase